MPPALLNRREKKERKREAQLAQARSDRARIIERATGQAPVALMRGGPMDGQQIAVRPEQDRIYYSTPSIPPAQYYTSADAATTQVGTWDIRSGVYTWVQNVNTTDWTSTASGSQIFIDNFETATDNLVAPWSAWNTAGTGQRVYQWQNDWAGDWNTTATVTAAWGADPVPAPALTQEEADRRLAAARQVAHRNAIQRKRAVKKGRKLLLDILTEEQQREYARTQSFTVHAVDGNVYRLRKRGTVHQLDAEGRGVFSHCIHLPYSYIEEDTLIGLKLLLETDPAEFKRIANTRPLTVAITNPMPTGELMAAMTQGFAAMNDAAARMAETMRGVARAADRVQQAINYADYARELEAQVAAEETGGIALPLRARQARAGLALGHDETIGGDPIPAPDTAIAA